MARIRVFPPAAATGLPFTGSQPVWHRAEPRVDRDRLAAIAGLLRQAWAAGAHPHDIALDHRTVLAVAAALSEPSLDEAIALVGSHLSAIYNLSEQSWARMVSEIARFAQYAEWYGATELAQITPSLAAEFIEQPITRRSGAREVPATGTQRVRRGGIRLLFGTARFLGLATGDPTIDIRLPSTSNNPIRSLDDDEEALGRIWSRRTLADTRRPAGWAIGQATATNSEAAALVVGDLNLSAGRVWLHGNERWRESRWGELTPWGIEQIERRLGEVGTDPSTPFLTAATASRNARQASTNILIADVLTFAGLKGRPGIKPMSLPAWAGRQVYEGTGSIEAAADALGMRDLNSVARMIGRAR